MTLLLAEMTRDEIGHIARKATAVLPTGSIEQHGPHLPVCTDSLLCETVVHRAAEKAAEQAPVVVVPILCYGNSHHHFPFTGVLSLSSRTFMTAVTEVLESLVLSGFRRLMILNGHGGNRDANGVVTQDFVNRLGHPVSIVTASYWEIARSALVEEGLISDELVPGHAGRFETSLIMAIRPKLINRNRLTQAVDVSQGRSAPVGQASTSARAGSGWTANSSFTRATWDGAFLPVRVHGVWAAGSGYTDNPAGATVEEGTAILDVIVQRVADFMIAFHRTS